MNSAIVKNAPLLGAAILCALSGCATMSPARADGLTAANSSGAALVELGSHHPAETRPLRFDVRIDVPAGLLLGATGATLVAVRPYLASTACRSTCTPGQVNGLDGWARGARWEDPVAARTVGDFVGYGGLPVLALASGLLGLWEGQSKREVLEDTWIVAQAFALSHVLESTIKYTSGRARPDTTFAPQGSQVADPSDQYTSMVSGHATAGFAVAVATAVVATMRGRKSAPWLWLTGLALASASSYLRIAADRHYLTDVLAGAALGSAMGVAVPLLFHGVSAPVTLAPQASASGAGLVVSGHW